MSAMRSASSSTTISMSATDTSLRSTEVDQAARGGHDHVDAAGGALDLALDVGAAVDGHDPQAGGRGQRARAPRAPGGPAHGWGPAPGPGAGRARRRRRQLDECGRPKARVLPEPVLALPQTSRPARASAHGQGLDGEGGGDALGGEGPDQGGVDAERGEGPRWSASVRRDRCGRIEDAIRGIGNGGHGVRKLSLIVQ